jgi:O-antigen/teichoic acid export membrane protein
VWIAVSTTVPFLATAALSVVAGRVLGAELLGQQSLIAFVGQLLSAVAIMSLTDACIRWLSAYRTGEPDRVAGLERWAMWAHLAAGVLAAGLLIAIGLARGTYVSAWAVVAATIVCDAVGWGRACRVIARDGWGPIARRRLITQLLAVGLGILAVLAGLGITGIFLANLVGSVVFVVMLQPLLQRAHTRSPHAHARPIVRLWLVFAGGAVLTQVVGGRIEILFLGVFASGEQIAHYTVAVMLVMSALTLPTALAGASMPAIAAATGAGDTDRARASLSRALRISAVLGLPLAAAIVAAGPPLILALYGDQFVEAAELSQYVALLAVIVPCGRLASSYWSGLGRLRIPVVAGIVGAVLEVGLSVALIPQFGARGAVAATLVGQSTVAAIATTLTWRTLGDVRLRVRGWIVCAAASALAAVAGIAVAGLGGLVGAAAAGLTTAVVFAALALLAGKLGSPVLDAEDARWLRDALPHRLGPLVRALGPG